MYVEPWQIFLCGCVVGTLIAFIVLTAFVIKLLGHMGMQKIKFDNGAESAKEAIENDLVAKLCFILLAKGYLDEVDNDFMLDNIAFQRWKEHVEEELAEPEEDEDEPKEE